MRSISIHCKYTKKVGIEKGFFMKKTPLGQRIEIRRFETLSDRRWTHLSSSGRKSKFDRFLPLIAVVLLVLSIGGCGIIKPVPVETNTEVHIKDSTVLHLVDSIRITEATRYKDMAWLGDTLRIEGSRSRMWAYADTTREAVLGGLEEDKVEEKTKIVYRDRISYKDSLVYQEVPIPVEVVKTKTPRWAWFTLGISLVSVLGLILLILKKLKLV